MKTYAKGSTKDSPLTKRRLELGLAVKDVAAYIGVVPQLLTNWFNLKYIPGDKYLDKLAEALQVTPEWIIGLYSDRKHKTTHSNFWTYKKSTAGITCKDIADYLKLNKDSSTIAKYFSGEIMPSDNTIKALCNMFDTDYSTGKAEFEKINKAYHANKKKKNPEETPVKEVPVTPTVTVSETPDTPDKVDDIMESIYGIVSYDEFFEIRDMVENNPNNEALPKLLYGKLGYDAFNAIFDISFKE